VSTPNATGGFAYLRNRWYDPQTGRFLTQDPIGLAGGVNLYAYAGNNPVTFTDPFGLCPNDVGGDGKTKSVDDCPKDVKDAWKDKHIHNTSSNNTDLEGVDSDLMDATVRASMDMRSDFGISAGRETGHACCAHDEGRAVDINQLNGTRMVTMNGPTQDYVSARMITAIYTRLPADRRAEFYSPSIAFRVDGRQMTASGWRNILQQHSNHLHVSVRPANQ